MAAGTSNGGPPPSTLAAQLVENISASARSHKSDENSELRGLFATIQRVKDDPASLKSHQEREEHNHMLIYVYCRVVLEGVQLEDPFLDKSHAHTEILKAINFLRFTIRETPSVLAYQRDAPQLLFRGSEPLWLWIFPRVLRLLGHSLLRELQTSIEGFFQYVLLMVASRGALRGLLPQMLEYCQNVLQTLLEKSTDPEVKASSPEVSCRFAVPSLEFIGRLLGSSKASEARQVTYQVERISQALRQMRSISRILLTLLLEDSLSKGPCATITATGPWLLDYWLDTTCATKRWQPHAESPVFDFIEWTIDVLRATTVTTLDHQIIRRKAVVLLILLAKDTLSDADTWKSHPTATLVYCKALIWIAHSARSYPNIGRLGASQLVQMTFVTFTDVEELPSLKDVRHCARLLQHLTDSNVASQSQENMPELSEFRDEQLRQLGIALFRSSPVSRWAQATLPQEEQPPGEEFVSDILRRSLRNVLKLEQMPDAGCIVVEDDFVGAFEAGSVTQRRLAIEIISTAGCLADRHGALAQTKSADLASIECPICDNGDASRKASANRSYEEAWTLFHRLIKLPAFTGSKVCRVTGMNGLRRLINHCSDPEHLHLETSEEGLWCLQSLLSSVRELRVAAGATLLSFLQASEAPAIKASRAGRNSANAIAFLRSASEKDDSHLVESCILAWGKIGLVVGPAELNLVLIKLLENLSSRNNLTSSFAFNEILKLADAKGKSPRQLLQPYWRSLAYLITKDMISNPQASRIVADLLQLSVQDLLLLIQTYAIPWLVLEKRTNVIRKFSEARQDSDVWRTVLDTSNLGPTISLLLMHDSDNAGALAKERLDAISTHFHSLTVVSLLQSEPVLISMELLKEAADPDSKRREMAINALETLAMMLSPQTVKQKKTNLVGRFLQSYVLGLMARLTDVITDTSSTYATGLDQERCLGAIKEMVTICGRYASVARPQITACLLEALTQESLRRPAFLCWIAMLTSFGEEDAEALIEVTIFVVRNYWPSLDSLLQLEVKKMLESLVADRSGMVQQKIHLMPSLSHISSLSSICKQLDTMREVLTTEEAIETFALRLRHENSGVVNLALQELTNFLNQHAQDPAFTDIGQRSSTAASALLRSLLDCVSKYAVIDLGVARLCTECLGLIGCLDPNNIESVREKRSIIVLNNFEGPDETTDFSLFLVSEVLVPSFLSATDTKLQGFLSFTMQELLERTDVSSAVTSRVSGVVDGEKYRKWLTLPETVREVTTPFLTSKYKVAPMPPVKVEYPIYRPGKTYNNWLRSFVVDLLHKGQNSEADLIFEPLTRVIRVKDLSAAEFLFPYLILHVLLGSRSHPEERLAIGTEILDVLGRQPSEGATYHEKEDSKKFYQAVFRVLDYAMQWMQSKRTSGRLSSTDKAQLSRVDEFLDSIPAELISQRAVMCNEYARALFHLENHTQRLDPAKHKAGSRARLMEQLQDIYANIDEPDGLEGISAHLHALDINQQILGHKKAGRWSTAQTWYEMQLADRPHDEDIQLELLNCLKNSGHHDALLNHVEALGATSKSRQVGKIMPLAVEAAWVTGRLDVLHKFLSMWQGSSTTDLSIFVATVFSNLDLKSRADVNQQHIRLMRSQIASELNFTATTSMQASHDLLLKCHVVTDIEMILTSSTDEKHRQATMDLLARRLDRIGAFSQDKQYVLGIQRAALSLVAPRYSDADISGLWLSSARLARKTGSLSHSFNAVLHASQLGDDAATIENAKLLWRDNHHRKAIQMLQGAIERNKFMTQSNASSSVSTSNMNKHQKLLTARAQLLLAKWLDTAGQSHASALREKYQQPPKTYPTWEKGHYYLGRHYKKVLEYEKPLKVDDQSDNYVTGEIARLVIENYVRSLNAGTKYLYQTLPRVLTLWLDLGAQLNKHPEGKGSISAELLRRRKEQLQTLHVFLDKYIDRIPPYMFYTVLPQIVARIAHPNSEVFQRLAKIICKVVAAHPQQALWSLIGVATAKDSTRTTATKQDVERKARGDHILQMLRNTGKASNSSSMDLRSLLRSGEKLAQQLLMACEQGDFSGNKTLKVSLRRDLGFNHKCTPCPLVVPVESELTGTLPVDATKVKTHQAFPRDVVTIDSFLDDVLVLSSLARPRRLTARGSDGKLYMLLIKPKDDLRTDQRLMEFNGMINRSLKRDAESSRRQLYIRTYAVVPLNEYCGIIEWVPGIKTMRDILLNLYSSLKIFPDYMLLKGLMEEASRGDNAAAIKIFTNDVLGKFPPMLSSWFIQQFPDPSAWFAARLRYTRSCAVMSMVGTILGLGDRHGENVNLEEGTGGIFHVDFNCLFDKGLTFAKPERVPFRLTHNMVAAMGIYGYEGPFRKTSELTLSILRQQEETLMSILEAFIYDPTMDLQKDKRAARRGEQGIKLQPQLVVDSIKRKVKGLLPNESIPLSVEGQVEELIKQAVDPRNLTAMYIGWCPFL